MNRQKLFEAPRINSINFMLLEGVLDRIELKIDHSENYEKEIEEFHKIAGKNDFYSTYNFENYWRSESKEAFLSEILIPEPPTIEDISYSEILTVLQKFEKGEIKFVSYYLKLLEKSTHYPQVHNLIFWPDSLGYDLHLSAESMADILLKNESPPKTP